MYINIFSNISISKSHVKNTTNLPSINFLTTDISVTEEYVFLLSFDSARILPFLGSFLAVLSIKKKKNDFPQKPANSSTVEGEKKEVSCIFLLLILFKPRRRREDFPKRRFLRR